MLKPLRLILLIFSMWLSLTEIQLPRGLFPAIVFSWLPGAAYGVTGECRMLLCASTPINEADSPFLMLPNEPKNGSFKLPPLPKDPPFLEPPTEPFLEPLFPLPNDPSEEEQAITSMSSSSSSTFLILMGMLLLSTVPFSSTSWPVLVLLTPSSWPINFCSWASFI